WNVQGRGRWMTTPFDKILPELVKNKADIICLQEMTDAEKKFSGLRQFEKYNFFIPEFNLRRDSRKEGFNHNILLSRFPIARAAELAFPFFPKKLVPLERAMWADLRIGGQNLRIYNCHFIIRLAGMATRLKQLEFILADAQKHKGPTIICGDMNVATPKQGISRQIIKSWNRWPKEELYFMGEPVRHSEKEAFARLIKQYGFAEILDMNVPTWSFLKTDFLEKPKLKLDGFFVNKLDWFLVKNLNLVEARLGEYISDHRPVSVKCKL